jgi:hypothetical protein
MASRLNLHEELCKILGTRNVYYDPPESVKMQYDAIRYTRKKIDNKPANNSVYKQDNSYEVIAIYRDADSDLPEKLSQLPMCSHDRHYVSNNLHHDVFTLYY